MTIDTACSGSLVSLDVACRYLQSGEIKGAIVATSNLYLSPEHVMDSKSSVYSFSRHIEPSVQVVNSIG